MKNKFNISFVLALSLALSAAIANAETGTSVSIESESAATVKTAPLSTPQPGIAIEKNFGVIGKPFVLDGSKSQDDGAVRTFVWKQVAGPTVKLLVLDRVKASFTPAVAGTYAFDLVVTDSTGLSFVAQKVYFTVDTAGPTAIEKPSLIPGYPEYESNPPAPESANIGDVDRDGLDDVVVGTDGKTEDHKGTSDASAGKGTITGDPDFDLLRMSMGKDDLEKMREEVSAEGTEKKVTVRGWNPEKKEEILAHPEKVRKPEELKVFIEAVALSDAAIKGITTTGKTVEIESREPAKLFGFIPVTMTSRVIVEFNLRDSTADPVSVRIPWWHVLASKDFDPAAVDGEITAVFNSSAWEEIDTSEEPVGPKHVSQALKLVSNVLKTRHDTAKNSIGNIR